MRETPPIFEMTTAPDARDREVLDQGLTAFNNARSPEYAALSQPEGKQQPLDVYIRDEQGRMLGGIACSTYWGWLYIGLLWLEDGIQRQGYGTQLIEMVEDEARRRGCTHSRVTTYSFQARGFYERMGYRVVGELTDFPPGGAYYLLRKD